MTDNCKHVVKIKTSIQLGILSPERWHCKVCQTTESVWACLSCTNFACGRYIAEHALQHFQATGHPLCIEVNEKFVFCYICDDFVLNDNAPGDIKLLRMALDAVTAQNFEELSRQKRGRRILRYHMRDCKKITQRLLKADDIQTAVARHRFSRLSWALRIWWTRYLEKKATDDTLSKLRTAPGKQKIPMSCSSAFTGLRNLGNTCYMNSVLQVLRHTASFANFILSHAPSEVLPQSRKRRAMKLGSDPDMKNVMVKRPSLCSALEENAPLYSPLNNGIKVTLPTPFTTGSTAINSPCTSFLRESQATQSTNCLKGKVKTEHVTHSDVEENSTGGLNGGRCAAAHAKDTRNSFTSSSNTTEESHPANRYLYEELYGMFRTLWSGQRTVVSPSSLLYTIWTALPSFKGYRQQDAQEFLSVFLDRLQSELHGNNCTVSVNSRDFVNRTFQGHCVSHVRCSACNVVACTAEPFSELSLALPLACYTGEATECELMDLLHKFFSPTPIDGSSYACRQCSGKELAVHGLQCSSVSFSCDSYDSCASNSSQPTSFSMDKLVSVTPSRLDSSPTDTPSFSSYGMKARHFPTPQALSTNSTSTSSSLSLTASPSLSSSLDDLDELPESGSGLTSTPLYPTTITLRTTTVVTETATISIPRSQPENQSRPTPLSHQEQQLTSATQTIRLTRLPRVLRLHIKRFRWIGRQREKVGCHVQFPLILDLSAFMLNSTDRAECNRPHMYDPQLSDQLNNSAWNKPESKTLFDSNHTETASPRFLYHLTGVIVHHGRGFQSGHYTAYCLNDQPECWLNCNDANVSLCDFNEVAAAQAYLLFYSELMPTTRYPTWFSGLPSNTAEPSPKQCKQALFNKPIVDKPEPNTPNPDRSKAGCRLRRTCSMPSHAFHLRNLHTRRFMATQSTTPKATTKLESLRTPVSTNLNQSTSSSANRSRPSTRQSTTSDIRP